jgi:hypothetical protein
VVPGVLQLLIDELQDMRRSVKCMKKDVHKLSSKQLCFSDMQHGTYTLPSISPFHTCLSCDLTRGGVQS